jgi:hypothetical protein
MFAFLKSIKLPFNKKFITCLSIVAVVLAILYLSGLTKFRTKPIWETYADEEVAGAGEEKNAIDTAADTIKAALGM